MQQQAEQISQSQERLTVGASSLEEAITLTGAASLIVGRFNLQDLLP
jgi:hypothetical protein